MYVCTLQIEVIEDGPANARKREVKYGRYCKSTNEEHAERVYGRCKVKYSA